MSGGDKSKMEPAQTANPGDKAIGAALARNGSSVQSPIETGDGLRSGARVGPLPEGLAPQPSARLAALQLHILDLESQVAALSQSIAEEKAKSRALAVSATSAAARATALEMELRAFSNARDSAGAVAVAAVTELREVKVMCEALLGERDAARSEREAARSAASAAEARIAELESTVVAKTTARPGDAEPVKTSKRGSSDEK